MRVKFNLSCIGLSLKENIGKDDRRFYQISIDQDGEAGTLPLSEECYKNIAPTFKKYNPCSLVCEYNDNYKTVRVIGVTQGR